MILLITGERKPAAGIDMTLDEAVFLVACLGGYGGRSAGPPGSVILGRGMKRLLGAVEVRRLVKGSGSRSALRTRLVRRRPYPRQIASAIRVMLSSPNLLLTKAASLCVCST